MIDVLVEIGEGRGVSAAQVALAWLLGRPGVTSLVIGARTDEQLADNLAAADLVLADDERARLDEVSAPPLLYPHWHQAKTRVRPPLGGRPGPARARTCEGVRPLCGREPEVLDSEARSVSGGTVIVSAR